MKTMTYTKKAHPKSPTKTFRVRSKVLTPDTSPMPPQAQIHRRVSGNPPERNQLKYLRSLLSGLGEGWMSSRREVE